MVTTSPMQTPSRAARVLLSTRVTTGPWRDGWISTPKGNSQTFTMYPFPGTRAAVVSTTDCVFVLRAWTDQCVRNTITRTAHQLSRIFAPCGSLPTSAHPNPSETILPNRYKVAHALDQRLKRGTRVQQTHNGEGCAARRPTVHPRTRKIKIIQAKNNN